MAVAKLDSFTGKTGRKSNSLGTRTWGQNSHRNRLKNIIFDFP
jgi:hypothetical protein